MNLGDVTDKTVPKMSLVSPPAHGGADSETDQRHCLGRRGKAGGPGQSQPEKYEVHSLVPDEDMTEDQVTERVDEAARKRQGEHEQTQGALVAVSARVDQLPRVSQN